MQVIGLGSWRARRRLQRQAVYALEARRLAAQGWYTDRLRDSGIDSSVRTLLDVGCGRGGWSCAALQLGVGALIAGDLDPDMVIPTATLLAESGTNSKWTALLFDACRLPVRDRSCDAVVSHVVLPYVPSEEDFLRELARVLRPEGHLYLTGHGAGSYLRAILRGNPLGLKPLFWTGLALLGLCKAPRQDRWQRARTVVHTLGREGLDVVTHVENRFLGLPVILRWTLRTRGR